jgi:phenylacetate-coenzyme A ligase PaaK-like adenylate-forming protein
LETFKSFASQIYSVNEQSFSDIALKLFRFQAVHNPVYRAFVEYLHTDVQKVDSIELIPFLPISFFKTTEVKTGHWVPEITFTSSATTGAPVSRHLLPDLNFYLQHSVRCFEFFFGSVKDFHFLALLPSYLERNGSSLIAMMDHFIRESQSSYSGFYLYDVDKLMRDIRSINTPDRKLILWGVSFALLDMAEQHAQALEVEIFETGGMKGRRREMTRNELHDTLKDAFGVNAIYSEYGMTELLSQAYASGGTHFKCPPWMRVIGRELTDPMNKGLLNETSGINVIDLANFHSVAFIETEDLGKVYNDGTFEVLGRADNTDVRGCNLLVN